MIGYWLCILLVSILFALSAWLIEADISLAQEPNETSLFIDSKLSFGDPFDIGLADLDSDGDLDVFLVYSNRRVNEVWLNDGFGIFRDSGQRFGESVGWRVELGDLDSDGDLDAFVANTGHYKEPNKVWLNDGFGIFRDSGQALGNAYSTEVKLGDLDSDGDLDAFVTNLTQTDEIWFNDGSGNFEDSGQFLSDLWGRAVDLGDLDSDDDLDAFVANGWTDSQPDQVWLNDGSGLFIDSGQLLGDLYSTDIELGDLDNDGDLDAIVTSEIGRNIIWMNDGSGKFYDSGGLGTSVSFAVALGDLDSDSDLDAFIANEGSSEVWLNNGVGKFIDSRQNLGKARHRSVILGDVDNDSDLDVFVASCCEYINELWLNETYNPPLEIPKTGAANPTHNLVFSLIGLGFSLLLTGILVRQSLKPS